MQEEVIDGFVKGAVRTSRGWLYASAGQENFGATYTRKAKVLSTKKIGEGTERANAGDAPGHGLSSRQTGLSVHLELSKHQVRVCGSWRAMCAPFPALSDNHVLRFRLLYV